MNEQRKGGVRNIRGKFYARVRIGKRRRLTVGLPACKTEESAEKRAAIIAEVATTLGPSRWYDVKNFARSIAAAETEREIRVLRLAAQRMAQTNATIIDDRETFEAFAKKWTDGDLHRDYPDHVPLKNSKSDRGILDLYVNKHIGPLPLAAIGIDQADTVMRSLPEGLSKARRRHVAQVIHRVLKLAAYPARVIPRSPLPPGWLPKLGPTKAFGYFYPDEDQLLLGCANIDLGTRVLYGFLCREGMRVGEALSLSWLDLDLERGVVTLDENKTDDPRAWALDPGVTRALILWKKIAGGSGPFAEVPIRRMACTLRDDMKLAGVNRAELHRESSSRKRMRIHDLRATFVTLSLANGATEQWVADRTGHKTSAMIQRYRRASRTAAELGLGPLSPLDVAIPELAEGGAKVGQRSGGGGVVLAMPQRGRKPGKTALVAPPGLEPGQLEELRDFKASVSDATSGERLGKRGARRGPTRPAKAVPHPAPHPLAAHAGALAEQIAVWDVFELFVAEEAGIDIPKRGGKR